MNKRQAKKKLHKYIWLINNNYRRTRVYKRRVHEKDIEWTHQFLAPYKLYKKEW